MIDQPGVGAAKHGLWQVEQGRATLDLQTVVNSQKWREEEFRTAY